MGTLYTGTTPVTNNQIIFSNQSSRTFTIKLVYGDVYNITPEPTFVKCSIQGINVLTIIVVFTFGFSYVSLGG